MRAALFDGPGRPLRLAEVPEPVPGPGELLIEVRSCGVCRTDLHILDGELDVPRTPLVPGHQIVGIVAGSDRRVGVPWLGWTCGRCEYWALRAREPLRPREVHPPRHRFWGKRTLRSVANLTRADGQALLRPPRSDDADPYHVRAYPLEEAGNALADLRAGRIRGAAVIDLEPSTGA